MASKGAAVALQAGRANLAAFDNPHKAEYLRALIFSVALSFAVPACGLAQAAHTSHSSELQTQQHYDAAFRLQDAGRIPEADAEHKLFLGSMLHRMANGRANLGEYAQAGPLYEEALQLTPADSSLQIDYAGAALDAGDSAKAAQLTKSALDLLPKTPCPKTATATSLFARSLWAAGKRQEALEEFKAAASMNADFDTSYALARSYLALADKPSATRVFAEMQARFGDTAVMHMWFGRAFAQANLFTESIAEFKKAVAKDDRLQGVHYSLGASYIQLYGEKGYPQAETEFRRELAYNTKDTFTYPQLGRIAMSEHKYAEAEANLKRAVQLSPYVPGTYYSMGQLYVEMGRSSEAEDALRKAISVTIDPSRNNYEGQRIHYALGRVLLEEGQTAEARKQLRLAQELLAESRQADASLMGGSAAERAPLEKTREARPADAATEKEYEEKAGPLIASSYDNLGVHAAIRGEYAAAARYFEQTSHWNPRLKGVDANWGRAEYAAQQYAGAIAPLSRALEAHPEDTEVRSMLGLSRYATYDYAGTLFVLQPMHSGLEASPALALAYAQSLVKAGDRIEGLTRLQHMVMEHPERALPHSLLGQAYASGGSYDLSIQELRAALRLNPRDPESQYALCTSLIALGQKAEAQALLSRLADSGSTDVEVYFQLGRLQLQASDVAPAINSLETAVRLNPGSAPCHHELAEAYRRNAQPEPAARETQVAATLEAKRR